MYTLEAYIHRLCECSSPPTPVDECIQWLIVHGPQELTLEESVPTLLERVRLMSLLQEGSEEEHSIHITHMQQKLQLQNEIMVVQEDTISALQICLQHQQTTVSELVNIKQLLQDVTDADSDTIQALLRCQHGSTTDLCNQLNASQQQLQATQFQLDLLQIQSTEKMNSLQAIHQSEKDTLHITVQELRNMCTNLKEQLMQAQSKLLNHKPPPCPAKPETPKKRRKQIPDFKPVRRQPNPSKTSSTTAQQDTHAPPKAVFHPPDPWFPPDSSLTFFKDQHPLLRPEEDTHKFHGARMQDAVGEGGNIYSAISEGKVLYAKQPCIAVELALKDVCLWSDEDMDHLRRNLGFKLVLHSRYQLQKYRSDVNHRIQQQFLMQDTATGKRFSLIESLSWVIRAARYASARLNNCSMLPKNLQIKLTWDGRPIGSLEQVLSLQSLHGHLCCIQCSLN